MKFISKSIEGYKGIKIPYKLYGKTEDSQDLYIFLPGSGYTVNSPVFHYTSGILFNNNKDILEINYSYKADLYHEFSKEEIIKAVKIDSRLVIDTVLETNTYKNFYFIGKSLGTIAMSSELRREKFKESKVIWLTPLLNLDEVIDTIVNSGNKGFCIIGDEDEIYSEELFGRLKQNTNLMSKLIPSANHSLDHNSDSIISIDILKDIITDIDTFLSEDY
ncbi:alpha/beta hydrolase [Psychrobacillus sp. FJAT-51614]|uniref:Alpha/beta hydrolase n=1 Tax=Psychrobacillus mangrovi TaxID=3117745 RepID=A0ABU8F2J4_9BACI